MRYNIYLTSLIILFGFPACSDSFLEQYPETSMNEGNFYKNEADFVGLANGLYIPLRNYSKVQFWLLAEIPSDNTTYMFNASENASGTWQAADQFLNTASTTGTFDSFWVTSYDGIARCNKLISEIEKTKILENSKVKDRAMGEAKFMRALYYFNLVRLFGGVPLITEPINYEEAVGIKRATLENVYELIVKDLKEANIHLEMASSIEETGRATKGASLALLGKVYLTLHRFDEAETVLGEVIEKGQYELLPDYADVFDPQNKNHKESIFSVQYSESNASLSQQFIFYFAPNTSKGEITLRPNINIYNSWHGWNMPTNDLLNAFEEGDKRKDVSIGVWIGEDYDLVVRPISYCQKYKPPISAPDNRAGDNFPILRYSDVLLMYAEVLNELGRTTEAIHFVQQVRNRAGLITPLTGYDKENLKSLIAKERQVEFCFENHRWFDLLRTGRALEVISSHGQREKSIKSFLRSDAYNITQNELLFPIPNVQVVINGLEQNPGY